MQQGSIPALLHCDQENDCVNWQDSPFYINKQTQAWPKPAGRERLGAVSAFGMSGTNAHIVVQGYGEARPDADAASYYLLVLSAKTEAALAERISDTVAFLQTADPSAAPLAHISHTLLVGRHHFHYRCAIVVRDSADAVAIWQDRAVQKHPRCC
ncbi:MAG: ketoacyl-synthetase C-terminal extension domain-containing protein [Methylovulum sp.]|nr:ketoacyl-synthetase C-terminal extension domain-containing protein [Methylovulum sp.]